jgi:hypothetical protein
VGRPLPETFPQFWGWIWQDRRKYSTPAELVRVERALLPSGFVVLQASGQECPLHTNAMNTAGRGLW